MAEVVHPSLAGAKSQRPETRHEIFWATEAGYLKSKNRIHAINDIEIVENAREIEAARALGDLRENSEFKFALERRSRLNSELRHLSHQLNQARIITAADISTEEVGIGAIVELEDLSGQRLTYTILGPWDADPDIGIVSSQSKFAQEMFGHKVGDVFAFKNDEYKILSIKSFLEP